MATVQSRAVCGSSQWVKEELQELDALVSQEVEGFGFSVRNEMEWLNEHMAGIFDENINMAEILKTPGKLRGKTPRAARLQDEGRAPLRDIFASNTIDKHIPVTSDPFTNNISHINAHVMFDAPQFPDKLGRPRTGKLHPDSGYHGMTEDEMDSENTSGGKKQRSNKTSTQTRTAEAGSPQNRDQLMVEPRSAEDSFVSAKEVTSDILHLTSPKAMNINTQTDDDLLEIDDIDFEPEDQSTPFASAKPESQAESSSPVNQVTRKSSLNFATLPPRETLTVKQSIGLQQTQTKDAHCNTVLADDDDDDDDDDDHGETKQDQPIQSMKRPEKTAAQLLHERITMLGQTREPRTSKSIPSLQRLSQNVVTNVNEQKEKVDEVDDDSWIAPMDVSPVNKKEETQRKTRPTTQQASISAPQLDSPNKLTGNVGRPKATSVSESNKQKGHTPPTSPKKFTDAPLSASKAKFYSVLKSAKGMFASSAGSSAQAKVETALPSTISATSLPDFDENNPDVPGGFQEDSVSTKTVNSAASKVISALISPIKETRKLRSSTESDKRKLAKEQMKSAGDLDKLRADERQTAAAQKKEQLQADVSYKEGGLAQSMNDANSTLKSRAPGRAAKPTRQAPTQLAKPVPVNIRIGVASHTSRIGSLHPSTSTASLAETAASQISRPPSANGRPAPNRAGSAVSVGGTRVKALEHAARRKEEEERLAQEKANAKKQIEQRKLEKLEADRKRAEEQRAEDTRRALEARNAREANKKLLEQKREQDRDRAIAVAAAAAKAKLEAEEAAAVEREKARIAAAAKREQSNQKASIKSNKRPLAGDNEEGNRTSTLNRGGVPYQQHDAKRRRTDDDVDEDVIESNVRKSSVMAPPKRPSTIRKEMVTKFSNGYMHAPPPAAHHVQNSYKPNSTMSTVNQTTARPTPTMLLSETIKVSNARIPFAENANAIVNTNEYSYSQHMKTMNPPVVPSSTTSTNAFKTPSRPVQMIQQQQQHKSSPAAYTQGDNIALPDINTDSEEDDDDNSDPDATPAAGAAAAFRAPSWAASPALRELLTQQQLVDPESVFGPIATLNMEEVFRGAQGKQQERLRRYRERGESAMWIETGDAVNSAEKRRDREARERVAKDGGWRFTRD